MTSDTLEHPAARPPDPAEPLNPGLPARPRWRRRAVAGLAMALIVGGTVYFFSARASKLAVTPAPASRDAPFLDGELIRFSPAFARLAALTTASVELSALAPVINVTGTVTYDTRKFAAVGARIRGRVHKVFKIDGDRVRAHEILAELESAELGQAEAAVLSARARELAAAAHLKRQRYLADAHVTAEREAELAKAEHDATRADRLAAERALEALGGEPDGAIGILKLRSPIAGKVVASKIARGQTVDPTGTAYEIADMSTVWVKLGVFERDLPAVKEGDTVEISTQGQRGETLTGRVDHVGDVIDVGTRAAEVRVVASNERGLLRPGQSIQARIRTAAARPEKFPVVPTVAVTRIDGKTTVFVLVAEGAVQVRAVTLGSEDEKNVTIAAGLKQGEQVVVGGMFALKSEIFR